jgi:hypothetical protein
MKIMAEVWKVAKVETKFIMKLSTSKIAATYGILRKRTM